MPIETCLCPGCVMYRRKRVKRKHEQKTAIINRVIEILEGYKVDDGISFEGSLPPADALASMMEDTNMVRETVNGIINMVIIDIANLTPPEKTTSDKPGV